MQKDNIGLWISAFVGLITAGGFFGKWLGGKLDKNAEEITNKLHIQELQRMIDRLEKEMNQLETRHEQLGRDFQNYKDKKHENY